MEQLNNEREFRALTIDCRPNETLSENALRQLSKSLTRLVPKNEIKDHELDLRHLQILYEDLLRTAESTTLSPAHGSASLNALCGFIEQCSSSSLQGLRDIAFTPTPWTRAFDIFLTRSERHKSKPVRRLLLALTDSLLKQPQETTRKLLTTYAVSHAVVAICEQQGIAYIKSAIQGLEHLTHKGVVTAVEIVDFMTPQSQNTRAIEDFNSTSLADREARTLTDSDAQWITLVENFTLSVLGWVQYPDCAPAAGRFLATFFASLNANKDYTAKLIITGQELPLWISPVKEVLERHPELLEAFEYHILPCLLHLSPNDTSAFLSTLRLDEVARGDVGSITIADLHLCILVAKVTIDYKPNNGADSANGFLDTRKDIRAVFPLEITSKGDNPHVVRGMDGVLVNLVDLGIQLLENASPSVRMAALSLLISSPALFKPPSRQVIYNLRRSLPHFHVEANAKSRNEFIALMKKLCIRLRATTMSLLRAGQTPENAGVENISDASADSKWDSRKHPSDIGDSLREHFALKRWYLLFLTQKLRPTASYQSHITALRILHALIKGEVAGRAAMSKIGIEYAKALNADVPRDSVIRPILDLLLDPFDDVRHWAALVWEAHFQFNLVQTFPSTKCKIEADAQCVRKDQQYDVANSIIHTALLRAELKAKITGRADHADGVGRLYYLLYEYNQVLGETISGHRSNLLLVDHLLSKLEEEVRISRGDLSQAVSNASLHGHLIALRHITSRPDYFVTLKPSTKTGLEMWRGVTDRIHLICSGVWDAVRDTLCFDAPEGHELDEEEADCNDPGAKDVLSFCWRALKESSSLLHTIVTNDGYGPVISSSEGLTYDDYYKIGGLSFTQLAELRHRGAFSTVSYTFAACCIACAGSSDPQVVSLVKAYYYDALACMQRNASALTRRSAGMPAMLRGILAAYLDSKFFHDSLLDLQAIADTPIVDLGTEHTPLPQVHALNCLKDIFTDARFGPSTEAHIADTLEIAASCLKNHIWSIRNCGLMLFKALLRRLNGGTDTASTKVPSSYRRSSNLIYERYPNLPGLVLTLLCNRRSLAIELADLDGYEVQPATYAHVVFSALEIVERSGLPHQYHNEISAAVWQHIESPDWLIREKAAKALSYVLDAKDLTNEAERVLTTDSPSQNALHGRLLCLRFLLARSDVQMLAYEALVPWIHARWEKIIVRYLCPITAATYLNVLADLCILLLRHRSLEAQSVFDQSQLSNQMRLMQVNELGRNPAWSLQICALKRCMSLKACIECLQTPLDRLSQSDVNAIIVLDDARQNMSDESCLAILQLVPPHDLRLELGITQYADASLAQSPHNAHEAHLALATRGYDLGVSYAEIEDAASQKQLSAWVRMLAVAGSEDSVSSNESLEVLTSNLRSQELRTRVAAAHSLRGFFDGMRDTNVQPGTAPRLLEVYLALYDTLVDDDEDVRDYGAKTVSSLLSAIVKDPTTGSSPGLSLSPPAAERTLQRFLQEGYQKSRAMFVEAARRLVGLKSTYQTTSYTLDGLIKDDANGVASQLRPVAELSLEARMTQLAVFVEEKQNLYLDTVTEAETWALLLVRIDGGAWDPDLTTALESWTIDGLLHLLQMAEDSNDNGALSPTSKPEVYTLYMRVILAAKVLMTQSSQFCSNGKSKEHPCKPLLEKLHKLGKQHLLHDLLLERIHLILDELMHSTGVAQ